ncbi:MAG: LysR substrate-binding domain-containing protein [Xanthobacteraceae bacterium]
MKRHQGKRRLPPLGSLRGFEAAARHMSFRDAAAELQLTEGAVSRQIKTLELNLGVPLFVRKTRQVHLTKAGERLFHAVRQALDIVEQAVTGMTGKARRKTLVLSALPTLTSTWIMPRLHEFIKHHSHIDLRIVASLDPVDLSDDHIDIAIRVGQLPGAQTATPPRPRIEHMMVENWDGVRADELFPDVLVPVCAPSLIGRRSITEARDLLRYPLIHTSTRRFAWSDWLRSHGVSRLPRPSRNLEFGHFFMSIEAALNGQGIAIIPRIILSLYKEAARLRRPIEATLPSAGGYYLLVPEDRLKVPEVAALHHWLLSEAARLHEAA